jgi:hypothetical protein
LLLFRLYGTKAAGWDRPEAQVESRSQKGRAPDRATLDAYLGNIRDVEKQLERMESRLGTITGNQEAPVGLPDAFDDHMAITYNLMHLAYQGDISRVFTS